MDPVDLLRQLEKLQDAFWRHAKELRPEAMPTEVRRAVPHPESTDASNPTPAEGGLIQADLQVPVLGQRKKRRYRRTKNNAYRAHGGLGPTRLTEYGRKYAHGSNPSPNERRSRCSSNFSSNIPNTIPAANYGPCSAEYANGGDRSW